MTDAAAAGEAWGIMRAMILSNERRKEVSDALGMSFARVKALRLIAQSPLPMGELASTLSIDAPYMTLVCDDLESQGLVQRKPHPTDRRAKLVEVTARGRRAARRAQDISERPPVALTELPAEDLASLVRILGAVHAAMEDAGTEKGGRKQKALRR